jgi:hypothetical protein
MQLSTLWAVVSLVVQSILRCLCINASQAGVVGEIFARFKERAEWYSRLEASGSRVCDLVPGPTNGRAHLVPHLEEAAGPLWVMQDEIQALSSLATQIWDLVLERTDEIPSLVVALSSTMKQIEGRIDAAATNRVHWWAWLALTTVLSHFPKLELTLELVGSGYNADLIKDEMEDLWIQTQRASESLTSGVPLLVSCSPPNSVGEE